MQSIQDPAATFADVRNCVANKLPRFKRREKILSLSHFAASVGFQARAWREDTPFPLPHVIETASLVTRKVRTVACKGEQVQHTEKSPLGSTFLREFPPPSRAGLAGLKLNGQSRAR